ncbi:Ca2+-dependent phosphoinositide-specific phospholipase C [Pedobacter sp. MW01-1-1]|uniref:Ca2+-dependent phosphoinositide-specific phospholipase C n=1 Tax=Pedobacter sp. MW01-1-1 TaxID=3383027 RepID=UPI003FEDCCE4
MKKITHIFSVFPVLFAFVSVAQVKTSSLENGSIKVPSDLKINQIQVLGTHNSYAKPVDPKVIALMNPIFEKMYDSYFSKMPEKEMQKFKEYHPNSMSFGEMLKYNHPDFSTQLNAGLRSLELDVYYDPTGNRFTKPAAYELLKQKGITDLASFDSLSLKKPGFKLLHMSDIDFRTHYPTYEMGLKDLKKWSDAHPSHTPIFIMVESKDSAMPLLPNSAKVLPFDERAFAELDSVTLAILGKDKIITPDDVRRDYKTLQEAVLANNWPTVKSSLGKFVFLLLPSAGGISSENTYIKDHPNLENRAMFVQSEIGQPNAAFLLLDNAIVRKKDIQEAIKLGYLVRTRSDIETYEAKVNDTTRAQAAFESGAQVISTDFFQKGNTYGTEYQVKMPNGKATRINPVNGQKNN